MSRSGICILTVAASPDVVLALCDLSTPEIRVDFHQFASSKKPAAQIRISGPYAPLKLLITPGKTSAGKTAFRIPCKAGKEKAVFKVDIK